MPICLRCKKGVAGRPRKDYRGICAVCLRNEAKETIMTEEGISNVGSDKKMDTEKPL